MDKPETPELDKATRHKDDAQAIGAFLEWLSERGITLARYSEDDGNLWPAHKPINAWLASYFGLDQAKMDAEQAAVLEYVRSLDWVRA